MKAVSNKYFLRLVTIFISIILIYTATGVSNGIQTKNATDNINNTRDTTYLSIVPSSQTVDYGETFSIVVHLDPGEPVIGVQIDLSFTASLIQVVSVTQANPIWFFLPPTINNTAGEIHGAAVVVFGTTVTTPIDCFQITFTAQNSDGISPLILHDVIVTDQNAQPIIPVIINNGQVIVGTPGNQPPFFGLPSPANGSIGNPLSLTWGIAIADPEGNPFSWTIQCSNGQSSSGMNAANGTKTLALSGLGYSLTYKVWVNATDPAPGSGVYTRRWYTFSTLAQNLPPVFGSPSPANGSTGNPLSLTWSIPISDPNGNLISWSIQCSNGQTSSGSGVGNGTRSLSLSGLGYSLTYKVWVNATDPAPGSGVYTRRWYTFSTLAQNLPPVFGSPSPANGSSNQPLSLSWSIPINDPEGNTFSWSIQCSNEQSVSETGSTNGTKSLALSDLAYATTYKIWVNATDPDGSGQYTRKWYTFTTQPQQNNPPNKPNTPTGTSSGKLNTPYVYSSSTIDPDGDQIYYMWYWGDGSQSDWLGPYNSGASINTSHTWTVKSSSVKIKAKDTAGSESPWSDPLPITMPKNSVFSFHMFIKQILERLFERFPQVFPILRQLLGY